MKRPLGTSDYPADLVKRYRPILWSWPIAIAKRKAELFEKRPAGEAFKLYIEITGDFLQWKELALLGGSPSERLRGEWWERWSTLPPALRKRGGETEPSDGELSERADDFLNIVATAWKRKHGAALELCRACEWIKSAALREIQMRSFAINEKHDTVDARERAENVAKAMKRLLRALSHPLVISPGTKRLLIEALDSLEADFADEAKGFILEYDTIDLRGKGSRWRKWAAERLAELGLREEQRRDVFRALALPTRS